MKTAKTHPLEKIKEMSKIKRLGYIDWRVHYNQGSIVCEILDMGEEKEFYIGGAGDWKPRKK